MEKADLQEILSGDDSIGEYLTVAADLAEACDDAAADTGWLFPILDTDMFKIKWIKQRARRHCYFKLMALAARKFKVEQLSLNQRFDHYEKLVTRLDTEFNEAIENNPEKFSDVDAYKMFGTIAGTGFIYDDLGRDRSYE
ncbi:MAG: hypothetical protein RBQ87_01260 [Candidatus Cloacimonadaceae bacterium]|nr:hypothetical protein [Candidatus Cloacimonadaceae bacterium]